MRLVPVLSLVLVGCGTRTELVTANPAGACDGTLSLAGSITLDAPQGDGQLSPPNLTWTGSEVLVTWTRWGGHQDQAIFVDPVHVSADGLTAAPVSTLGAGNAQGPDLGFAAAWDGSAVALAWGQGDGSIVLQHVGADGAATDSMRTVVAPKGVQRMVSGLLPVPGGYLITWGESLGADGGHGWPVVQTFAAAFADGAAASGNGTVLFTDTEWEGATLYALGDRVLSLWMTGTAGVTPGPSTTILASLDRETAAVQAVMTFDGESELVVDPAHQRLDIAVASSDGTFDVMRGTFGGAFWTYATGTAGGVGMPELALVMHPCAGLVALVPLSNGYVFQRVMDDGMLGPPVTLPLADSAAAVGIVPVTGGVVAAWREPPPAPQALHVAFVRVE